MVNVQGAGSAVWLSPAPYYRSRNGSHDSFTINLWFKVDSARGELFQYLLSHMGDDDGSDWGPNQVWAPCPT